MSLKEWKGAIQRSPTEADEALTDQEETFVEVYVHNGGNGPLAVEAAGITGMPKYYHNILLKKPSVRLAIQAKRDLVIKTGGATKAWAVMDKLMTDPNVPPQIQFQAARWTLEASGHGLSAIAASIQLGLNERNKSIGELPISELMEIVERGADKFNTLKGTVKRAIKEHQNTIDLNEQRGTPTETNQGAGTGSHGPPGEAPGS